MDFSPLNALSAEVRLRIYEVSLCTQGDIVIVLEDFYHISEGSQFIRPRVPQPNLLALIRTCNLIRHEALPIFLAQNHFKIYVERTIGSASHNQVRMVAQKCFDCFGAFGRYASQMRHLDISMDEGRDAARIESLPKRRTLIRELQTLFGFMGPTMTVEMQLSGGVTSEMRPNVHPVIRRFNPVPPIRIELAYATDAENERAIE